jgi:transposase
MGDMRPYGTNEQLGQRRERGLRLLRRGKKPLEVAHRLGVTERSVRRWHQEAQAPPKPKSERGPGRPAFLSAQQVDQLKKALEQGAFALGYAEDYWTLDRIAHVIWDLFHVRYHPTAVWRLMQRIGWSSQKPQRQPLHREDEAIERWRRTSWYRIKKVA